MESKESVNVSVKPPPLEQKRKKLEPLDSTGFTEFYVAVIGNVDSGKSSLTGILTNPGMLDDGNGKARATVLRHPHEHASGRTSDISYQYVKNLEHKRITTFIDLAGHEQYLRTTISGLSSGYPDMALVCISDKITKMTKEHIGLAISMSIPILILFTKTDMIPLDITAGLITTMKKILATVKRKLYHMRSADDFKTIEKDPVGLIPFVMVSNKSGVGLDLVNYAVNTFPKKKRTLINGFAVETIYNVMGHGTVVSGMVGSAVKKGDILYIGPMDKGDFYEVKVKSLHNDYRHFVDDLAVGTRGCLCIAVNKLNRQKLRAGMVLKHEKPKNVCKKFLATVKIFHHHTTIKAGYQAYANCGMIRETVQFNSINNLKSKDTGILRSGEEAEVEIEFSKNLNYIEEGQTLLFREGATRGSGVVVKLL
jgi:GTPase